MQMINQPTFHDLLETGAHDVNVLNAHKLELDIRVEVLVLISFSSRPVGHGVYLRPRVNDIHEWRGGVCLADSL